jgi:hypothetical protein
MGADADERVPLVRAADGGAPGKPAAAHAAAAAAAAHAAAHPTTLAAAGMWWALARLWFVSAERRTARAYAATAAGLSLATVALMMRVSDVQVGRQ